MATLAVLFDLGNTLVGYYTPEEFPQILKLCLCECAVALDWGADSGRDRELFDRALRLNYELPDFRVRPLHERLRELFSLYEPRTMHKFRR